jgi:hypothetical protein
MTFLRSRVAAVAVAATIGLGALATGAAQAVAAPAPAARTVAAMAAADNGATIIQGNSVLPKGSSWVSPDNQTGVAMQGDGHVVLYHNGVATWAANWTINRGDHFVMQGDGNLVAYDASNAPVWWSGTNGHPGAYLAVQDDGNLVVYQGTTPLWYPALNAGYPQPSTPPVHFPPNCPTPGLPLAQPGWTYSPSCLGYPFTSWPY